MSLPRVSKEVIGSYAAELLRDIGCGKGIVEGNYGAIERDNPVLLSFMESLSNCRGQDPKQQAIYQLGFLQCYALLNRQAEVSDLERKTG